MEVQKTVRTSENYGTFTFKATILKANFLKATIVKATMLKATILKTTRLKAQNYNKAKMLKPEGHNAKGSKLSQRHKGHKT